MRVLMRDDMKIGMKNDMKRFKNRIKELREERQLTQLELGILTGKDQGAISVLERGISSPDAETIATLARVFKVEPYELFASPALVEHEATSDEE